MPDGPQTVVPGQTTGTTPPFLPSPGGGTPGVDDQTKRLLDMILRTATQRRFAGQPRPSAVPGRQDPFQPPSYMTSGPNPHAWGAQRLMYGIQSMMKNAVAHHKEEQVNKAMADWEYAQSALNEYYNAQASGDQNALATAQKKLDVVFGDPKKLKNMAKALNQDWLNPEKTTVYGEALKKVAANTQQKDQQKQNAKQGITNMFKRLIGRSQPQPQLSPEQKQGIEKEVIEKAPTTVAGFDLNTLRTVADFEKAANAARVTYQVRPAADGTLEAFNPKNPNEPTIPLRDSEGKPLMGKAPPKEGTLYTLNGMPQGVFHQGKPVYPGDPEWNEHDQKIFDQGAFSAKEKQLLRVEPSIAAMVGDPPNPADYKKGRSDPEYGKALSKWGQGVFAKEKEKAEAIGEARAKAFNEYRGVDVMDEQGNVFYTTMKNAIDMGMTGAGEGIKLRPREAQINDIQVASGKMRDAINSMKEPKFSVGQIAKLRYALETEDPSLANTELSALASQDLTEEQQDFVIWVRQLNERAMSLRNVAGMGTGAQDLRSAIRALIPGIRSGSKQMMLKQLDAFDNQVKILKGGIAHPGVKKTGAAGGVANVIVVTPEDMGKP